MLHMSQNESDVVSINAATEFDAITHSNLMPSSRCQVALVAVGMTVLKYTPEENSARLSHRENIPPAPKCARLKPFTRFSAAEFKKFLCSCTQTLCSFHVIESSGRSRAQEGKQLGFNLLMCNKCFFGFSFMSCAALYHVIFEPTNR